MPSRAQAYRERLRAKAAENRERAKTCTHVDKGTRTGAGCLGGTRRTWCAWCGTLLHDTLWDLSDDA